MRAEGMESVLVRDGSNGASRGKTLRSQNALERTTTICWSQAHFAGFLAALLNLATSPTGGTARRGLPHPRPLVITGGKAWADVLWLQMQNECWSRSSQNFSTNHYPLSPIPKFCLSVVSSSLKFSKFEDSFVLFLKLKYPKNEPLQLSPTISNFSCHNSFS